MTIFGLTILGLMGVLIGAVLGLRFKMLVLVPVICGALTFIGIDGIARGDTLWRLVFTMIMIAVALQLGYMLGIVLRFVMSTGRAGNRDRVSIPSSAGISGSV
jgi:hypothetical protein